jgi:hypothetical protein
MRNITLLLAAMLALPGELLAQATFTSRPDLLPYSTHSGNCMAVTDMNGDGRDDIAVLDNSNFLKVLYQNVDGKFAGFDAGSMGTDQQWGMAVADMDNDGQKDAFSGGFYDGQHYLRTMGPGPAAEGSVEYAEMFMQCTSSGDINNDGWLDVLGCDDNGAPSIWINDGQGNLDVNAYMDFTTVPASDMSGNYGSVFTDFDNDGDLDLFIAHCRQGVNDPEDPRRWNRLFVNDGNEQYSDQTDAYGLTNHYQSWAVDFGDWDNDGDLDQTVVNHDHTMQFLSNDGTGHFTEIGDNGLNIIGFLLQVHMEDFDNDGFLDILVSGGSQFYLKGNGDGTFTPVEDVFPAGSDVMHGYAIGDLNNDGFMDVWANYGSGYVTPTNTADRLWLNDGNENHWLNVRLQGVASNRDGIGARVTLSTALGTQVREARSGESYGLTNTALCHFGLGSNTDVASITVHWPSGQVDTYTDIAADQQINLVEGQCITPSVAITSSHNFFPCYPGEAITLTASGGGSYLWDSGEQSASITVDEPGYHTVTVDGGSACSTTASAFITNYQGFVPSITANGDLTFCEGQSLTLTASSSGNYVWNTGETTPSITVTDSGYYSVTVDTICTGVSSIPVHVGWSPPTPAPSSADVNILVPGTALLHAEGDSIRWFDVPEGGEPVGEGNDWTTPWITENTTYWCADAAPAELDTIHGGMPGPSPEPGEEGDPSYYPIFECWSPFVLKSVLVHALFPGNRMVGLVEWPGGTTILSGNFYLPAGNSRIELNWPITPGSYGLRMFGSNIGMTYEDVSGTYPYPLGNVGAIVSTTNGGSGATAYYEIFYDWEVVATQYGCESLRTPVNVTIGPVGVPDGADRHGTRLYPVPAQGSLQMDLRTWQGPVAYQATDLAGRTVVQGQTTGGGVRDLDVSHLAPGGYQMRFTGTEGVVVKRFVVR